MEIKINGLKELNLRLEKLTKSLDADKVEPVTFGGAEILTNEMIARAPVGPTGNLKSSPRTVQLKRQGNKPAPSIAAIDRRKAPHAHLVEFGTSKTKKQPFVRQSQDAKGPEVVKYVTDGIKRLIEEGAR